MSFLNPISEPVLMYSSTDANAPKINYAARAAGDVKTVLKACLVTGYGTKAGAGWTIQNETASSARFASPSVAMSNYRFGVDDSSSQTLWYYLYKNVKTSPSYNNPSKSFYNIDDTHANNGWRLLVTKRGIIFIELYYSTEVNAVMCRMTYIGQVKSTLASDGKNILFWCTGISAPNSYPTNEIRQVKHCFVNNYTDLYFTAANMAFIEPTLLPRNISTVEVINSIFLHNNSNVIAEVPGILLNAVNDDLKLFGCYVTTFESRSMLYVCLGRNIVLDEAKIYSIGILIYLDKWEY